MSKLTKLWLNDLRPPTEHWREPLVEIRLDWDNDRHHAVKINYPYVRKDVAEALRQLLYLIETDFTLTEERRHV